MKLRSLVVVLSAALIGAGAPGFALADHDRQDSDRRFSRAEREARALERERERMRRDGYQTRGYGYGYGHSEGPNGYSPYGYGAATPYAAPFPPGYGPYGKLTPLQSDGY
jgi:hypothetical protein